MSNKQLSRTSVSAVKAESFSGPIPPPSILSEYENRFPGFGERILAMAERESAHRHELENANQKVAAEEFRAARSETRIGQILACVICIAAFAAAVLCAWIKQPVPAGIIAGTTLVSIVSTLLNRSRK